MYSAARHELEITCQGKEPNNVQTVLRAHHDKSRPFKNAKELERFGSGLEKC